MTIAPSATRPRANAWLVVGGVATVALLVLGALTAAGWIGYRSQTQTHTYSATPTSIAVELGTGDLTLTVGDPGVVTVTRTVAWSWIEPSFAETWDGQTLRVTGSCNAEIFSPICAVDYALSVPDSVAVTVHSGTGDILVHGIHGQVDLTTSTGDIRVDGTSGPVTLRTGTGDITANGVTAPTVQASTDTGDVRLQLSAPPGNVTVHTGTGDIRVTVPDSEPYRVQASTGTGDTRITVPRDDTAPREIIAQTGTGDITIASG